MTLSAITGGAGTGKTTRLLALVDTWLGSHGLLSGQRVLALTFMHGSRLQLTERLRKSQAQGRFECATFDGFAREVCLRWRSRLAAMGTVIPSEGDKAFYEATCDAAAALLADRIVARWVASAFPLIVVDEFQDCYGARSLFVEALATVAAVVVAADPFQDLRHDGANPAMDMLARVGVQAEELTTVHRTNVSGLLAAASALRAGTPIVQGAGLRLVSVPKHPLAAFEVCNAIANSKTTSPVVISASRPTPTNFAGRVINAVETTSGYGPSKSLGPYSVPWESSPDAYREDAMSRLAPDDLPRTASEILQALPSGNPLGRGIREWIERQHRLCGRSQFPATEIRAQIGRAESAHRALPRHRGGRRALTIHQAKNREFKRVVVLWGFAVPKEPEIQRRLLYNAITRAQEAACILVEDPKRDRLGKPPFR